MRPWWILISYISYTVAAAAANVFLTQTACGTCSPGGWGSWLTSITISSHGAMSDLTASRCDTRLMSRPFTWQPTTQMLSVLQTVLDLQCCCLQCFDAVGWVAGRASELSGGVLAWLSVWSKVQTCICPSWCHCHSLSLASVKSRLVLPFWHRITWVVPKRAVKRMCVCIQYWTYVIHSTVHVGLVVEFLKEIT